MLIFARYAHPQMNGVCFDRWNLYSQFLSPVRVAINSQNVKSNNLIIMSANRALGNAFVNFFNAPIYRVFDDVMLNNVDYGEEYGPGNHDGGNNNWM